MKNIFTHRKKVMQERILEIEDYVNASFKRNHAELKEKPFYHYNEWTGWRFYLKAIKYKDWKSIKGKFFNTL